MAYAMQVRQTGGPEVLNWTAVDVGEPGSGQVRLRQAAAGLNYIDVYHRTGYYPQPLPFIPGLEGAGTVEAVAQDVRGLKVGDRVAYAGPAGGYSDVRLIEADRLVRLPEAISFDQAAAMMLQGMTAQVLIRQILPSRREGIGARNLRFHRPDYLTQYPQEFAMSKTAITSPELAPPVGPFSQAIEVGGFLYFSGQVGQDPATGRVVEGGIVAETERVFRNLSAVLKAAGRSFDHVARAGVYLTNMSDFGAMNGIYAKHFTQPFPARTTIAVAALPLGACVEIDLVVKA
jgi:reactive intermediate/imine deaminase